MEIALKSQPIAALNIHALHIHVKLANIENKLFVLKRKLERVFKQ